MRPIRQAVGKLVRREMREIVLWRRIGGRPARQDGMGLVFVIAGVVTVSLRARVRVAVMVVVGHDVDAGGGRHALSDGGGVGQRHGNGSEEEREEPEEGDDPAQRRSCWPE